MAAPTNISALTATPIAVGQTITQRVDDAGTTYTVWYVVTPTQPFALLGVFAFGDLTVYSAELWVYTGPASAPVQYLITDAANLPVQFPVTPGTPYYLQIVPNGGNPTPSNLTLNVIGLLASLAPAGSILVQDDTGGFPGIVISDVNGDNNHVLASLPNFAASEAMARLPSGVLAALNGDTNETWLYSPTLTRTGVVASGTQGFIAAAVAANTFLLGSAGGGPTPASVRLLSATGVLGATFTFEEAGMFGLGVSPDATIAYYTGQGGVRDVTIQRWDLVNNVALSDLAPGPGAGIMASRLLVLADGLIVAAYVGGSPQVYALRYSPVGAILNTYTFAGGSAEDPRMALALDDPISFVIWIKQTDFMTSNFWRLVAADGSVAALVTGIQYEFGVYNADPTLTPLARFGHSESCDLVVLSQAIVPPLPPRPGRPGCGA